MFQDSEFYRFGNAEAHLTPLTEVVAPALTWHMAFLIAPSEEQKKDESNAENLLHIVKEQIKTKIDEIVIKMIKAIRKNEENRDVFIDPCIESTSILFSRYVNKESLAPLLVQESSGDAAGHGRVDHDSGEKPRHLPTPLPRDAISESMARWIVVICRPSAKTS